MDGTMDKIVIEVESNSTDAQNGLKNLVKSLKQLQKVSETAAGVDDTGVGKIQQLANAIDSLVTSGSGEGFSKTLSNLRRLTKLDFSNFTGVSQAAQNVADMVSSAASSIGGNATTGNSNIAGTTSTSGGSVTGSSAGLGKIKSDMDKISTVDCFMKSHTSLQLLQQQADNLKAKMQEFMDAGGDTGSAKFTGMAQQLRNLQTRIDESSRKTSKFKQILEKLKTVGKKVGGVLATPFKAFGNKVKAASDKINSLFKDMVRVAKYRLFRSMLSAIGQSIKEGTQNVYRYSNAIGGTFAKSMDSAYSSLSYFKNSLGAAVAPLINALAPALDYVIDKVVSLINILNQLFAKLSGATTWTKAVKQQKSYGDSLDSSSGSAKELKKTLMGFDELNLLNDNSNSSGGGGSEDYGSMFEETPIDSGIADFANSLKEAFSNGDWETLGSLVGEKVNGIFESISWSEIGNKIGYYLNGAISTAYSFLKTTDFTALGGDIATLINSGLENMDFETVGGLAIQKKFLVLFDTLFGLINGLDWGLLGKSLGDFIKGAFDEAGERLATIDWSEVALNAMNNLINFLEQSDPKGIAQSISNALSNALDAFIAIVGTIDWGSLVFEIFHWLGEFISGVDITELLAKIGAVVLEIIVQLPGFIIDALAGVTDVISGIFEGLGMDSVAGFFDGITEKLKNVGTWLKTNLVDPVVNWVKNLFGIHSPSTVFANIGTNLIDGMLQGIKNTWSNITSWFSEKFSSLKTTISNTWTSIKTNATTAWSGIKSSLSTTWSSIKSTASSTFSSLTSSVNSSWNTMKSNASSMLSSLSSSFSSKFASVKSTVSNAVSNIKSAMNFSWKLPTLKLPHVTVTYTAATSTIAKWFGISSIPHLSISWYANGGFPDMGQLFVAREAGAEMVGQIGGRTAVANNDDIVQAVSEGVFKAVTQANENGNGNVIQFVVDGKVFYEQIVSRNRREVQRTGLNPLLV